MVRVRPYVPEDRDFILSLAPRLAIGMQTWRDRDGFYHRLGFHDEDVTLTKLL